MTSSKTNKLTLLLCTVAILSGCAQIKTLKNFISPSHQDGAPSTDIDLTNTPDPTPKAEPLSAFGNAPTYTVLGKTYHVLPTATGYHKIGKASWYGTKFHGRLTSTREPYNMFAMTAASPELPIPCYVQVKNLDNQRTAVVRVNDRGPFHGNRIMDLSYAAAQKLGMLKRGTATIEITAINPNTTSTETDQVTATLSSIQVGAFSNRYNANKLKQKLQKHAQLTSAHIVRHGGLFRVIIGPLPATKQTKALALLDQLNLSALLTQEHQA